MTGDELILALGLPPAGRVDRRVPKNLLLENGAPTAADKRQIAEGVEELFWLAALKPTTVGVADHRDEAREYLEIVVLHLKLRAEAKTVRLTELVHRAIPYPVLLVTEQGAMSEISTAHKRWAKNEAGKVVLDGDVVATGWISDHSPAHQSAFRSALAVDRQPRINLFALYQGWVNALSALKVSRVTGVFSLGADAAQVSARQEALRECGRLDGEIARLRAAARKEKQLHRQVDLNMELKRLEAARAAAQAKL